MSYFCRHSTLRSCVSRRYKKTGLSSRFFMFAWKFYIDSKACSISVIIFFEYKVNNEVYAVFVIVYVRVLDENPISC